MRKKGKKEENERRRWHKNKWERRVEGGRIKKKKRKVRRGNQNNG